MRFESAPHCIPHQYRLLTESQIKCLHTATIEILETVGVRIEHGPARRMLADAGGSIAENGNVLIPGEMVEKAIDSAPSRITVYNRQGEKALHLEGRRVHFGMGTDLAKTYDLETGRLRASTLKDVRTAVHIADALPEIDFIASYAIPTDSPPNMIYVDAFRAQLENSTKPRKSVENSTKHRKFGGKFPPKFWDPNNSTKHRKSGGKIPPKFGRRNKC